MIPCLYTETETAFINNGIGKLCDASSCYVTEKRNGSYELKMEYSASGLHAEDLVEGNIILAKPSERATYQPFRIYKITTPLSGVLEIAARHIQYQENFITVSPFSAVGSQAAMAALKSHATTDCPFSFWTDIGSSATFTITSPATVRGCLGGMDGSMLDTYGGEYEWDMYTAMLHGHRGADHGVKIVYGKNLIDFKMERSIENMITGVHPYWKHSEDGTLFELPEKVVTIEHDGPFEKISVLDCTSQFEEKPTEAQLRNYVKSYLKNTSLTEPDIDIKIDFAQLWQTPGYADIAEAERVSLCDTVHVYISKLGIEVSCKVTETEYDVLLERYKSITLSNATVYSRNSSLSSSLGSLKDEAQLATEAINRVETQVTDVRTLTVQQEYFNMLASGLFGLHYSSGVEEDGSTIRYAHTSERLADSAWAWKSGMKDILGGFSIDDYIASAPGVVLTLPEVNENTLITTKDNYATDDEGTKFFTASKIGDIDRAGIVVDGSLGPIVQRNNVVLTENFQLKGNQTYTFYVDSDKSENFYLWVADASTGAVIPMKDTVSFAFVTGTKPYGTFVPAEDVTAYIRMQVPDSMTFDHFRMHLYLLEGEVALDNIRALVTPAMLEERASMLKAALNTEKALTESDADCFNAHSIHAQQVSDLVRSRNLARIVSGRRANGDIVHTCTAFGRLDPAGGIANGHLSSDGGLSTMYLSDYIEFEAGERYTIYLDTEEKTASFAMYFYEKDTGIVLQENGSNRGFNNRTEPFSWFTPDRSGLFRAGFYASNSILDNVEFHIYVLKGEYRREDFLGMASGPQIADSVSAMSKVKDWVRKANLVTCGSRAVLSSNTTDDLVTVFPVGAHDRAGAIVSGTLGASVNIPYHRYSEPFEVEAGKSYTVLMTDEDPDADYKIMFTLDPQASSVRQNGSVRYFDIKTEPFGLLIPDVSGPIRVNIYSQKDCSFDHHIFHVYVLEGVYSKSQMLATADAGDSLDYEAFGLPVLKLTGSMTGVTKEVTGTFGYTYGDLSGSCTMKWQGGSSLSYPKKNFTIKFDKKFEAKDGWGNRKKYVLKANYIDFSHARNIVCARLWGQVVNGAAPNG